MKKIKKLTKEEAEEKVSEELYKEMKKQAPEAAEINSQLDKMQMLSGPGKKHLKKISLKKSLNRRKVILLLYLLHHYGYPADIAKEFKKWNKSKKGKLSKRHLESLADEDKVRELLGEMYKNKLVVKKKICTRRKSPESYYAPNPRLFSMAEGGHSDLVRISSFSDHIFRIWKISPPVYWCIDGILSLKKYDFLTIQVYVYDLLDQMRYYLQEEVPSAATGLPERSIDYFLNVEELWRLLGTPIQRKEVGKELESDLKELSEEIRAEAFEERGIPSRRGFGLTLFKPIS
jgi:hypothetical protein